MIEAQESRAGRQAVTSFDAQPEQKAHEQADHESGRVVADGAIPGWEIRARQACFRRDGLSTGAVHLSATGTTCVA